ncbi:N-acetyl-gamma-glutamyl-phosphate reductase [Halolactibacillus miurensis]|uniref:N-acetyl-gamma-glutamyl-phosphate reductase n=1 Tax=Halolactibacillus miurensis TaxID=306541 RepID=A0A1I6Q7R3_9BACI|nr:MULTISPECIES: N-acetyl-gamma-glutamyl-phosphate reductase [Halolactibacillus]GEM03221.1 N-acetyl-gamma-glutamyl-phosphate reductase [Halolactibacillus miurensis]SFS48509.1 N-acetyl-gamma-glutamyl-phosphate reductase [Halolactibacillus miurensis]
MNVGIVGGTGYGAIELMRFLTNHQAVEKMYLYSQSKQGTNISDVYPHLDTIIDVAMEELTVEHVARHVDVLFFATPPAVSHKWVPALLETEVKIIDLSGDFRLADPAVYEAWYNKTTASKAYLNQAVYGLADVYRDKIKDAQLIANPGCYPTATLLGLLPVIDQAFIDRNSIIVDGKTGVSGAGRSLSQGVHYAEMNENTRAYAVGSHKHTPEIERFLSEKTEKSIFINFTPHIVPMTRGILVTMYVNLTEAISEEAIRELYQSFYRDRAFVRVKPGHSLPETKQVYGSNYCDLHITVDERTQRLIIVSVIDNLVKGASGQAIQNMNLLYGLDETEGLNLSPLYP